MTLRFSNIISAWIFLVRPSRCESDLLFTLEFRIQKHIYILTNENVPNLTFIHILQNLLKTKHEKNKISGTNLQSTCYKARQCTNRSSSTTIDWRTSTRPKYLRQLRTPHCVSADSKPISQRENKNWIWVSIKTNKNIFHTKTHTNHIRRTPAVRHRCAIVHRSTPLLLLLLSLLSLFDQLAAKKIHQRAIDYFYTFFVSCSWDEFLLDSEPCNRRAQFFIPYAHSKYVAITNDWKRHTNTGTTKWRMHWHTATTEYPGTGCRSSPKLTVAVSVHWIEPNDVQNGSSPNMRRIRIEQIASMRWLWRRNCVSKQSKPDSSRIPRPNALDTALVEFLCCCWILYVSNQKSIGCVPLYPSSYFLPRSSMLDFKIRTNLFNSKTLISRKTFRQKWFALGSDIRKIKWPWPNSAHFLGQIFENNCRHDCLKFNSFFGIQACFPPLFKCLYLPTGMMNHSVSIRQSNLAVNGNIRKIPKDLGNKDTGMNRRRIHFFDVRICFCTCDLCFVLIFFSFSLLVGILWPSAMQAINDKILPSIKNRFFSVWLLLTKCGSFYSLPEQNSV